VGDTEVVADCCRALEFLAVALTVMKGDTRNIVSFFKKVVEKDGRIHPS
jgi:hypothetical protein